MGKLASGFFLRLDLFPLTSVCFCALLYGFASPVSPSLLPWLRKRLHTVEIVQQLYCYYEGCRLEEVEMEKGVMSKQLQDED